MRFSRSLRLYIGSLIAVFSVVQFSLAQYSISSVAGGGPNNLPALQSSLGFAQSVALDGAGNVYIADSYSSHIFKVSTTGTLPSWPEMGPWATRAITVPQRPQL